LKHPYRTLSDDSEKCAGYQKLKTYRELPRTEVMAG
jgi:hypothetical protein